MSTVDDIYHEIVRLPDRDRLELFHKLWGDVPREGWEAEIDRRCEALRNGSMVTHSWEDVRQEVRQGILDACNSPIG